jgi:hypothetical protein
MRPIGENTAAFFLELNRGIDCYIGTLFSRVFGIIHIHPRFLQFVPSFKLVLDKNWAAPLPEIKKLASS